MYNVPLNPIHSNEDLKDNEQTSFPHSTSSLTSCPWPTTTKGFPDISQLMTRGKSWFHQQSSNCNEIRELVGWRLFVKCKENKQHIFFWGKKKLLVFKGIWALLGSSRFKKKKKVSLHTAKYLLESTGKACNGSLDFPGKRGAKKPYITPQGLSF